MGQILFLGTASAVADQQHENTHIAVRQGEQTILIDAPGSPVVRLQQAGISLDSISDLILTHFHPDHVSGAPILLMDMWLRGRKHGLRVHGLAHTIDRLEQMLNLYDWKRWPDFFPVEFHRLPEDRPAAVVLEQADLRILAAPVKHLMPTIGLRIEINGQPARAAAYSCDTEPCDAMLELGKSVDLLIHEATGESVGHSSARQAGEIGRQAGAKNLFLIHYEPRLDGRGQMDLIEQARETFDGPVVLARDFMVVEL